MVKISFYLLLDQILHLSFWSYGRKIVQRQDPENIGPLEDIQVMAGCFRVYVQGTGEFGGIPDLPVIMGGLHPEPAQGLRRDP